MVFLEPNCFCIPISYILHHIVKARTTLCPDVKNIYCWLQQPGQRFGRTTRNPSGCASLLFHFHPVPHKPFSGFGPACISHCCCHCGFQCKPGKLPIDAIPRKITIGMFVTPPSSHTCRRGINWLS